MPSQINIVPMIDVIFAILTFFIISTLYLTRSQGLPVNLPKAGTAQSQNSTPIAVTIDEKGNLALNRKSTNLEALESQVEALIPSGKEVVVILNADEQVNHGKVIAVMDRVRRARGAKLTIATKQL
ncbi:biopolymer transporter ExbD [Nostoc sp. HG1]|nr:biopolymer transporter ExbD [Nostoc sp. HG1]